MAMKEDDLVRLMDAYMGCEGYYMKPQIEKNGKSSWHKRRKEITDFYRQPKG